MPPISAKEYALETQGELISELQQTLNRLSLSPDRPGTVFHFTDTDGAIAIVSKRSLRGTLFSALSDASEGTVGAKRAVEIAGEILADERRVQSDGRFDSEFVRLIGDKAAFDLLSPVDVRFCVVSFCARADISLHWSHYGRNGRGWALEFTSEGLTVADAQLVRVRYKHNEQREIVEALMSTARAFAASHTEGVRADIAERLYTLYAHTAVSFIRMSSYLFKDEVFQYEDEWRLPFHLVVADDDTPKYPEGYRSEVGYRSVDGRMSAYADVFYPNDKFPLASMILGYSCMSSVDDDAVRILLENSLAGDRGKAIPITRSPVPVRP